MSLSTQIIFLFYCVQWTPIKYGKVEYPMGAHAIGFVMSLASMLWIPGYAVYFVVFKQRGSLRDVRSICTIFIENFTRLFFLFQRLIKGITPDIKSSRTKAPAKNTLPKEIQMSESSARLLKNASFLTNNASSFNIDNP